MTQIQQQRSKLNNKKRKKVQWILVKVLARNKFSMSRRIHPAFQAKTVIKLECKYCERCVCARGMRALLLADTKVELFSTDLPPEDAIQLVGKDYSTANCNCRVKDVACLGCGNIVGYHVTLPCHACIKSCNNGHFWMFHSESTYPTERLDKSGVQVLLWGSLPSSSEDQEMNKYDFFEDECCR